MPGKDILSIINLIQNSGSAVNERDLHALLPRRVAEKDFKKELSELESGGKLFRIDNLIIKEKNFSHKRNREISRKIYKDNTRYLKIFSYLPWVRFISLTGSNAFESCFEKDDIDLFVISATDRLWIVYIMIVILSKLLKKRPFFCFNYLIDENNITFSQQSYHNAVQIYMMKPLFNGHYKKAIYDHNPWISIHLPNKKEIYEVSPFYRLRPDFKPKKSTFKWFTKINYFIYKKYKSHLTQKFPDSINKGILLGSGHAKLHLNDKSHIYDAMMNYNNQD